MGIISPIFTWYNICPRKAPCTSGKHSWFALYNVAQSPSFPLCFSIMGIIAPIFTWYNICLRKAPCASGKHSWFALYNVAQSPSFLLCFSFNKHYLLGQTQQCTPYASHGCWRDPRCLKSTDHIETSRENEYKYRSSVEKLTVVEQFISELRLFLESVEYQLRCQLDGKLNLDSAP